MAPPCFPLRLYDTRLFTFKEVLAVPNLWFDSMNMWVDQAELQIYVAVNDDLLRIPSAS